MSWENTPLDVWSEWLHDHANALTNDDLAELISRFELVPAFAVAEGVNGAIHKGPLQVVGDFTQPALLTVIDGDLIVNGTLSTAEVEGFDGNATLVVFGDLRCDALNNGWGSKVIVTGNCVVKNWVLASREDSSFVVGEDFTTPIFIGADLWVTVGGTAQMDTGIGYAVPLSFGGNAVGAPTTMPKGGWRELTQSLKLPEANNQYDVVRTLERRLHQTGTLMP